MTGQARRCAGGRSALAWLIVVWDILEEATAVTAGLLAGSIALLGFGIDSVIEVFAAAVVIWQLHAGPRARQRPALRLIAVSFLALAAGHPQVVSDLIGVDRPGTSLGLGLHAVAAVMTRRHRWPHDGAHCHWEPRRDDARHSAEGNRSSGSGVSMRRVLVIAIVAGVLAGTAASTGGCASDSPAATGPAWEAPAEDWPAGGKEAEVYVQVLRRYLSTPADNSFPQQTFKTVYVLDEAHPDAGDPRGTRERGTPIAPHTQRRVTTALADVALVAFIADRRTVMETKDGCPQVKGGGILITLGTANGDDNKVQVGINGFIACLGATWLTYVVQNKSGSGWRVTGTTGSSAIS